MTNSDWINDPSLSEIDHNKLLFLDKLFIKSLSLKQKEMLPFLLSLNKQSKEHNISFNKTEIQLIINVIKKYASPDEIERIEKLSILL